MTKRGLILALGLAIAALAPLSGQSAKVATGVPQSLFLNPVGAFQYPTYVTSPPGDQQRLLVVEHGGLIKLVLNGVVQPTPFLDAQTWVSQGGDKGMLSMAFAPDYATSRRFYVFYTDLNGNVRIDEVLRDANDPNVADPTTRRQVIVIPHPNTDNHYGGQLQFGPDGMLYLSVGDGGCCGDPFRTAQDLGSDLGKLLRIDPRQDGTNAYRIPPNNPFFGQQLVDPEIWSYGLRNPWRFSFDRLTGDLTMGDVGQDTWEEVDYRPVQLGWGDGTNFGWSCFEARFVYLPNFFQDAPCKRTNPLAYAEPVFYYPHGGERGGCSVTGGYVDRDTELALLAGRYIYGDYCSGEIYSQQLGTPNSSDDQDTGLNVPLLGSFGEDACGHIYAVGVSDGSANNVFRIRETDPPPPDCESQFPLPVLTADVGQNDEFTIHLHGPDGQDLNGSTLPEGSYRLEVDDYSTFHNFHLVGDRTVSCVPSSDCATTVAGVGHESWVVNLTPGTVQYVCDPHRTFMNGSFTVTGTGHQPLRKTVRRGA
jgi:glucose/arabinose dehydrogenase